MTADRFTTWGPRQGGCGHYHHARAAARSCLRRHRYACEDLGIASDRRVYIDGHPALGTLALRALDEVPS